MGRLYKILVVDDQVANLKIMVNYLQNQNRGFDLLQANSGAKALSIASGMVPDLIITDWDMPEMNGIDLIKALKNSPNTRNIPVVMATGVMLTSHNLMLALEAGAVDYIRKPIDPVELQARVNSALTIAEYHKKALDAKNHELAGYALSMVKQNEFHQLMHEQLQSLLKNNGHVVEYRQAVGQLINMLEERLRLSDYDRFDVVFAEVHPSFNKNLLSRFPDLTAGELRLCAYIRMGLSIKDVAALTCNTPESVKVSRSRLRKKLGLDASDNIESFLMGV